jgi:hypothetical protein
MRLAAVLLLALALPAAPNWIVYLTHAGPIHLGMTVAQVRRAIHDPVAQLDTPTQEYNLDVCAYLDSRILSQDIGIMFIHYRVARIDVYAPGIRTASGVGVGETEARVKAAYPGRISVEPHHYNPETGHYLIYSPTNHSEQNYGIVFETEDGKVRSFRVGTRAAIALVEGCS